MTAAADLMHSYYNGTEQTQHGVNLPLRGTTIGTVVFDHSLLLSP